MEKPTKWADTVENAFKRCSDGLRQFKNHAVGAAKLIWEVKTRHLWKLKYSSLNEYYEKEIGFSKQWAIELYKTYNAIIEIEAVKLLDLESEENKAILQNLNTRQAKALSGLPTPKKAEVLTQAIKASGGKSPKPEAIAAARRDYSDVYLSGNGTPNESEVRKDKIGRPIPDAILPEWDRAHDIGTKLRSMVSEVKCVLQKGLEGKTESDKDIIFRELGNSIISEAEALHYSISQILPYAVCPKCQGKTRDTCMMCRQRGFVSKFYWDGPIVGNDLRNVIKRQYANSQAISA